MGGVFYCGAQRGATGCKSEILQRTGTSMLMQPAVDPAKHMKGILMGAETQNTHGKPFVMVVQDIPAYDPAMSDGLIPISRHIEAGFTIIDRIASQAKEDGLSLRGVPLYGSTITTPDGVMEYAHYTWRLPPQSSKRHTKSSTPIVDSGKPFNLLDGINNVALDDEGYVPGYLNFLFWDLRVFIKDYSARGARNNEIERHRVRSCQAPQMPRKEGESVLILQS